MFGWLFGGGGGQPVTGRSGDGDRKEPMTAPQVDPEYARRNNLPWCECRRMYGGCSIPGMCRI